MSKTRKIILLSMLSAVGFILMLIEFPTFTSWLKFDISDTIVVLTATLFGPISASIVAFLKATIHYLIKGSMVGIPLDQIIAFTSSLVYMLPFYFVYKKTDKLWLASISGILSLTIILTFLNYVYFTPLYLELAGWPLPDEFLKYIVVTYVPFNILKSIAISVIYVLIHKRLSELLKNMLKLK